MHTQHFPSAKYGFVDAAIPNDIFVHSITFQTAQLQKNKRVTFYWRLVTQCNYLKTACRGGLGQVVTKDIYIIIRFLHKSLILQCVSFFFKENSHVLRKSFYFC